MCVCMSFFLYVCMFIYIYFSNMLCMRQVETKAKKIKAVYMCVNEDVFAVVVKLLHFCSPFTLVAK